MPTPAIDLEAYFARIGHVHGRTPTLTTLQQLQAQHTRAIPFENLSPWLGEDVELEAGALQDKLVTRGRGGYCYEHNLLFLHVLHALGFEARGLAARVLWNAPEGAFRARTHMLLLVEVPGERMIVDTGFGGMTPTQPLRFETDIEQSTLHEPYRLVGHAESYYTLQTRIAGAWKTLYAFDLQAQQLPDYQLANWYLSHHPASHFVTDLIAARPAPGCRHALRNTRYTVHGLDGETQHQTLTSVAQLRDTLESAFGIRLPVQAGLERRFQSLIEQYAE